MPNVPAMPSPLGWWKRWWKRHNPLTNQEPLHQLMLVAQHTPHQFVFCDKDERIQWVNHAFETLTGYRLAEIIGRRPSDFLHCAQTDLSVNQRVRDAMQAGLPARAEILNQARDGRLYWIDMDLQPVHNRQGTVTGFISVQIEITDQIEQRHHLCESRERFKSLLTMSSDWYWEVDQDSRITEISEGIDHTGLDRLNLIGKQLQDIGINATDPSWTAHCAALTARQPYRNYEFCIKHPSAQQTNEPLWLWVSLSGEPMIDANGKFTGYRGVGRDITAHRAAQDRVWALANLDTLTGLPNRLNFNAALSQAIPDAARLGKSFALALIDLDNFKEVNDTQGHEVGDELLAAVAKRLRAALHPNDLIARLGGDEFGVLIHSEHGTAVNPVLPQQLDALMQVMALPFHVNGQLRRCSLSMGVTLYPTDTTESASLIKNADIALYRAKAAGRGQYVLFHPKLKLAVDRQALLVQEIEEAIRTRSLLLFYQPVVNVNCGSVVSLEALLRWQHPVRGIVSAGIFPQVFDNLGIAAQIGRLVTDMAVAQAAQWLRAKVPFNRVAINVTAADFVLGAFPTVLAERLAHYGVPASAIGVEVTEGMFLGNTAVLVLQGLAVLHGMGIEIAFDDFGTGYASLMHLKLPLDRLKIDRSFVHDMGADTDNARTNAAIVHTVMALGHRLGKHITVEGVETLRQVTLLREMGCTQFQGNYYSKPLGGKDVPAFISAFNLAQSPLNEAIIEVVIEAHI